jgi:hypothetical protein
MNSGAFRQRINEFSELAVAGRSPIPATLQTREMD